MTTQVKKAESITNFTGTWLTTVQKKIHSEATGLDLCFPDTGSSQVNPES